MNKQILTTSALAAILSLAAAQPAFAADTGKEKCYGVAKAGANDCASATGAHACVGQAKMDNDPNSFKLVAMGSCEKMGGMLKPAGKK
ncbi:DUF2282 domain-containing protein [Uliginosibacterium paludis]|uniref:DUF2282 domain-containing protein n=1 Tax=Uliginosibacterium paludis TaxID=1615952 RepID=A0ABV2CNH6_9RHOO